MIKEKIINHKTIFISHRGESYDAPENTLSSINLAWQRNADAVEIDVQLSKDNRIIVIHDENTKKISGKSLFVKDQNLDTLKKLDVGSYKGVQWKGERLSTLEEVLQTIPHGKILFIEIKCGTKILTPLKKSLNSSNVSPEQIKIIGFDRQLMSIIKKDLPQLKVFLIFDIRNTKDSYEPSVHNMVSEAINAGLDGLDVSVNRVVDKTFVDTVKRAGLKLYVWTTNDLSVALDLMNSGIDGITSDRASWLKQQLQHK